MIAWGGHFRSSAVPASVPAHDVLSMTWQSYGTYLVGAGLAVSQDPHAPLGLGECRNRAA